MTEIKGWHVLSGFVLAFGVIIAVNLTLAYNAVRTFPGLEVKNSYVASQSFEADRAAQNALNWSANARVENGELILVIAKKGQPIAPEIISATFGRATNIAADQTPDFTFDGTAHVAPILAGAGNWNLRVWLRASDGTNFKQRIQVRVSE